MNDITNDIIRKIVEDIQKEIDKIFENNIEHSCTCTTATTENTLTKEKLDEMLELFKPEYAILIYNEIPFNQVFKVANFNEDYYCKKLLVMSNTSYLVFMCHNVEKLFNNIEVYYM